VAVGQFQNVEDSCPPRPLRCFIPSPHGPRRGRPTLEHAGPHYLPRRTRGTLRGYIMRRWRMPQFAHPCPQRPPCPGRQRLRTTPRGRPVTPVSGTTSVPSMKGPTHSFLGQIRAR
jgi:hypothetical protein